MKFKSVLKLLIVAAFISIGTKSANACHALDIINFTLTQTAGGVEVDGQSTSPTCGCDEYWLDIEIRCVNIAFDGAPFDPTQYLGLNTYPYFQSAQMLKPSCVVQNYPTTTLPYSSLCPGVDYKVRVRENNNGNAGPWTTAITFTAPGTIDPLTIDITATETSVCPGDCTTLTANVTGGCGLQPQYTWSNGANTQSITVCPGATTTYSVEVYEICTELTANASITITVGGIISMTCPPGLTAVCDIAEQPPYPDWNAFQAAGGSVNMDPSATLDIPTFSLVSEVSDGNSCPETVTRTYQIADDCGVYESCTQTIVINDVVPPTASNPAAINVQCAGDVPAANTAVVNDEADNCTVNPTVTFISDVSDNGSCPETITRTYRVTDACGNYTDVTQTITINDDTNPTGTAPADQTVSCFGDVPAVNINDVTGVSDNCTAAPTVTHVGDVNSGGACPFDVTRTYRITDDCGNFIEVDQIITVNDNVNPTGTAPAPVAVQCIGDVPAADPALITDEADNCTANPTVTHVGDASDGLSCPETITRTYRITDDCGNYIDVNQTITVNDDTNPTASAPAPIAVQCAGDVPAPNTADVNDEADNCTAAPTVTHLGDASDGLSCPETITRTFRITDDCGNYIDVDQIITINDDTNPTASAPAPVAVQCIGDVPAPNTADVNDEADNCTAAPTVTHIGDASDGLSCPETISRTYRITDDCGNYIDVVQTITVNDDIDPVATAPAPIAVQCIGDVPAPNIADVTGVSDNCTATPTVTHVGDASDGLSCPETITRTYEITDDCGNSITVTQEITVDDTQDPTASNPAPISATGSAPPPDITDVDDEADNCTANPTVAFVSDVSDGQNCPETIIRTFSVTDDCGNQITVEQTITIGDSVTPTASNPTPIGVQCIGDVPAPDPAVVTDEADNGAPPTVTWEDDTSDGNTCPETITRRYRVTDDCGNFIFVEQTITVLDDINPTGTAPAPITVQCIGDVPADDPTLITDEADNCSSVPTVTFVGDVSDGNTCPETITRTYRITDDCGNFTDVDQTITVLDDINPTGTAPAPVTVQCIGDVPADDPTLITDEADNCSAAPTVTFVGDVSDGNTCPETITRTYRITDDCGNFTDVDQTITVLDDINPTGTAPAPVSVQCIGDVPMDDPTLITDEADNCTAAPTVTFVGDVSDGNTCPETITRTYRITDDCGNFIEVDQTITVNDDIDPTATAPAPAAVQCIGDVPAADVTAITDEADNCTAAPTVTHVGDVSDGNTCPEVITRTYRIEDACGNFIEVDQVITVNDDVAPTASNPATTTVQCVTDVPAVDVAVVTDEADNCTAAPTVTFISETSDNNVCNGEELTRVYEIEDDCGNTTTVSHTIIIDSYTPTFAVAGTDPTACGANDGYITVTGLNPNESYGISYNGNPAQTVNTDANGEYIIGGLTAGSYTDFVIYLSSCPPCSQTDNTNINLVDPNAPPVDAGPDQTVCEGTQVTVTADNPNGANISWDNGVTDGTPFTPAVGTTNYTVTAELAGCTSTDLMVVTVNPIPAVNAGNDVAVCQGEQVTLSGSGADSYVWDNGVTDGVSFVPSTTTTYTVTGTSLGCSATDDVVVTVYDNPDVTFSADNIVGCIPQEVNFSNDTPNSATCEWNIDGNIISDDCSPSYTFTTPGCFDVSLTVTSNDGCTETFTEQNYICIDGYPNADFYANPAELTSIFNETDFINNSTGATTYEWDFGDGNGSTSENPSHTYPGEEENEFLVQLIATSQYGCQDTAYQTVLMREELIFYVPNTFTPDNDDFNETFKPVFTSGFDPMSYTLFIYDRWGETIFESNNAEVGWDGTYGTDSEELVKDGTYVWKIIFKTKYKDKRVVKVGHVNVLK